MLAWVLKRESVFSAYAFRPRIVRLGMPNCFQCAKDPGAPVDFLTPTDRLAPPDGYTPNAFFSMGSVTWILPKACRVGVFDSAREPTAHSAAESTFVLSQNILVDDFGYRLKDVKAVIHSVQVRFDAGDAFALNLDQRFEYRVSKQQVFAKRDALGERDLSNPASAGPNVERRQNPAMRPAPRVVCPGRPEIRRG